MVELPRHEKEQLVNAGFFWLWSLLLTQAGIYVWLWQLSADFVYGLDHGLRPILLVVCLLAVAFVLHLLSLRLALRFSHQRKLWWTIIAGACLFRCILLFSAPIQEVDIYRYCWDGAVLREGVSPFRYSPAEVALASPGDAGIPESLARLVAMRDSDPGLRQVLERVHYAQLTTIYPPSSQVVFALADWLTPRGASTLVRVFVMKSTIVCFDFLTLLLIARLLALLRLPIGWVIAYAWCPLVLKEFANSGHLDAIAVALTVASVVLLADWLIPSGEGDRDRTAVARRRSWLKLVGSSVFLALAVGAKLFPIVLAPIFAVTMMRGELNTAAFLRVAIWAGVFCLICGIVLWPMFAPAPSPSRLRGGVTPTAQPNDDGLTEFLSRWEMNDLLFMFVKENLDSFENKKQRPWFRVVPWEPREQLGVWMSRKLGWPRSRVAFLAARVITLLAFGCISLFYCLRLWQKERSAVERVTVAKSMMEGIFLTLAWFWLLSPTQNPWYWTWALPFVTFARNRLWLAMSGLTLTYYSRFWFLYQLPSTQVLQTGYAGTAFFDYVIVWLEFGPFLVVLAASTLLRCLRQNSPH